MPPGQDGQQRSVEPRAVAVQRPVKLFHERGIGERPVVRLVHVDARVLSAG